MCKDSLGLVTSLFNACYCDVVRMSFRVFAKSVSIFVLWVLHPLVERPGVCNVGCAIGCSV
jgi:hypothetical protein